MLGQFIPTSCWTNALKNGSVCIKCVHVNQNEISSDFPFMFVDSLEVSLSTMFHAQIKAVKSVIPFCHLKEWLVSYLSEKGSVVEPVEGTSAPEKWWKYDFKLVMNPFSLHPGLVSELSSSSKEIYQPKSCFLNYDYISCSWSADSAINGGSAIHLYSLRCTPPHYTDLYGW